MKLERDRVRIESGLFAGTTTGSPLALTIDNRSRVAPEKQPERTVPRPGHADLAGFLKFAPRDLNPVIERASARETAMRTALGAVARIFLEALDARVAGYVTAIGGRGVNLSSGPLPRLAIGEGTEADWREFLRRRDASSLACPVAGKDAGDLRARIDEAATAGVTLGGVVEVLAVGIPPGLGSYAQAGARLDGALGQALLSIPSVKALEIGDGVALASTRGSDAHDEPFVDQGRIRRQTNRAGGLEGGVTNGAPLRVRLHLKPIPTQKAALRSFDLRSGEGCAVPYIRSDTVVVPAASVIAEAVVALVLARAMREKFGGDSMEDTRAALASYRRRLPWGAGLPLWGSDPGGA